MLTVRLHSHATTATTATAARVRPCDNLWAATSRCICAAPPPTHTHLPCAPPAHAHTHAANPDAYAFQPENALKVKPWDHSTQDTTLLDLIPFLQMVQEVHVDVSVYAGSWWAGDGIGGWSGQTRGLCGPQGAECFVLR